MTRAGVDVPDAIPQAIPAYGALDYLSDYLTNVTSPLVVQGKPWDFGSTNFVQFRKPGGGTTFWDYWGEGEPWTSANHEWRDAIGDWHNYYSETVRDCSGKAYTSYVLLDVKGPGVMDKLWFTHDPTTSFLGIVGLANPPNLFLSLDSPDLTQWGDLSKVGNLRIEVDDDIVYDGPIENWFSGDAQHLNSDLKKIFVWRYSQFGSDGNIIPIPYQRRLKVSVYGGTGKPKWFMATGITFPSGTTLESYIGEPNASLSDQMQPLAQNVLTPETYINSLNPMTIPMTVKPGGPAIMVSKGSGTIEALDFRISKHYDPRKLWMKVQYGDQVGIDLPLLAFFSEPDEISLHHSAPIGLIEDGDSYLFYSNLPMPYRDGFKIEVSGDVSSEVPISASFGISSGEPYDTQLRSLYQPPSTQQIYGPDYLVNVPGDGKLVGLVLVTKDQGYDRIPLVIDYHTSNESTEFRKWPMGYLEGNLTIRDGAGNARYYSGQEDWAEGGFYFNSGYNLPPGGGNRPFGGILTFESGPNGRATLFRYFNDLSAFPFHKGLSMSFGHGTWNNNFPVSYGVTILYYHLVGLPGPALSEATENK